VPRRSRKLPIASGQGADPDLAISEADWQRNQKAYGKHPSDSVRTAIVEATRDFLLFEVLEREAEPVANAEKRIAVCKKAAEDLRCVMLSGQSSDAEAYARYLIMKHFRDAPLSNKAGSSYVGSFYSLASLLTSFLSACDRALMDLDSIPRKPSLGLLGDLGAPPSIEEGRAWRLWIRRLTGIMKANGLPTGVRKDEGNKSKSDKQSPFVLFVRELQHCLPDGCKYPKHSDPALAKAIERARRVSGPIKRRFPSE
jgi:hypothetical protein